VTSLPIIGYNVIMTKRWLGIVGRNGSGKSSVCDYLGSKGYRVVSLSDVVRHYATKQQMAHTRTNLTELANQLKAENGLTFFAEATHQEVQSEQLVVFDSVRHPKEIDYLSQQGVIFIGIDADLKDCYDRIKARGKDTDFVTFDEFKKQDEYEMSGKSRGQSIMDCLNKCEYRIENNQGLPHLFDAIDGILETVFKE
jgi:dephospho-CoA kinase